MKRRQSAKSKSADCLRPDLRFRPSASLDMSIEELEERMAADGETRNQSESEIEAEHEEQPEEEEDEDDNSSAQGSVVASKKRKEGPENGEARTQTRAKKVQIEYIPQKERRQVTFSKRKAGIMKKAYELSTLTGTQVLLLIVSENGVVCTSSYGEAMSL